MYVDTLDADELVKIGIDAMLSSLDPYTEYFPEEDMGELKMMTTGKYGGMGSIIRMRKDSVVVIGEPYANMPAAEVGLKVGDVLTQVDGHKLKQFGDLQGIIAQKRPGDKVTVKYLRNKQEKTATLTLKNEQGNTGVVKNPDVDVLGIDVRPVTDSQKNQLNISYGLEVIKVSGGKMKDAGVPKGFIILRVNDDNMKTFDDLRDAVKKASTTKEQMLVIRGLFPTGKLGGFVVYLQNE
jgi:S1-C subfamily serine protease